jgi:hypothetical protein
VTTQGEGARAKRAPTPGHRTGFNSTLMGNRRKKALEPDAQRIADRLSGLRIDYYRRRGMEPPPPPTEEGDDE